MTKDKDLKRRVRARMKKTGESYTAALANLREEPAADPGELAGMSDAAVRAKTGKDWREWVAALDALDARERSHRDIAKIVRDQWPDIGGWWAQTVTVGYERIRGLRDKGQQRDGTYQAGKSRTFPVSVGELYRAFHDEERRRAWLGDVALTIRTAIADKSMRITWPDGTSVHAYFTAKGEAKSSVTVQHVELASKGDVDRAKAEWADRFDALKAIL